MDHDDIPMYTRRDRAFTAELRRAAPKEFAAYSALAAEAVGRDGDAISQKYRELIAIGVALTTQCVHCLDSHVTAARRAGATEAEVAETVFVTAALRAGAAVAHGRTALRFYKEAEG